MSSTPPTPSSPETQSPLPWWFVIALAIFPGVMLGLMESDGVLLPVAAIERFHAALLQATAIRATGGPLLWDTTSILGGFPLYAAQGGSTYPGYLPFLFLASPFTAWTWILVLHLCWSAWLLANYQRRLPLRPPDSALWYSWLVLCPEVFFGLQEPVILLALPWAVWCWTADAITTRPAILTFAHWMLCAGVAATLGPIGYGVLLLAALGFFVVRRQSMPLLAALAGALLGAHQLLPSLMQPETHDWSRLGVALLLAIRPWALALVILAQPNWRQHRIPLLLCIGAVIGLYPLETGFIALGITLVVIAISLLPLPLPGPRPDRVALGGLVGLWLVTFAFFPSLTFEFNQLQSMVDETRSLLPRESHPSIAVVQADESTRIPSPESPLSQWLSPLPDRSATYFSTPAGPLLWNLAPDRDLAAAAVALPWSPRWREQLANLDALHKDAKGQKVNELIQFEYFAQGLGLNTLVGKYGDLPMLDYRRVDAQHLGQMPAPPYAPDAERDALQEQVLEQLTAVEDAPEELPKPPALWKQEPVLGRFFYQAKGNLPFAILADRPAKPLSLTPGPWPVLQAKALEKLQTDTSYPFFTSPTEKERYLVLADDSPDGTVKTPATIVVDRGEAVDVSPKIERTADGLTMHMRIPRTTSPWLILRQSLVRGWTCTVDGVAAPIARADGVWMAIPLPTDKEATIELRYTVPGLTLGRGISAAMAAVWLVLGVIGMRTAGRFSSSAPTSTTADAAPPDPK